MGNTGLMIVFGIVVLAFAVFGLGCVMLGLLDQWRQNPNRRLPKRHY